MPKHRLLYSGLLCLALGCIGPTRRPAAAWVPDGAGPRYASYVVLDRQLTVATRDRVIRLPHGRVLNFVGPIEIGQVPYLRYVDAGDDDGIQPMYYFRLDGTPAGFLYSRGAMGSARGMETIVSLEPASFRLKNHVSAVQAEPAD
jgi:hypothetical protein